MVIILVILLPMSRSGYETSRIHLTPAPTFPLSLESPLEDLYVRGTPENTLRAYERHLIYITAWKQASFEQDLAWPERQEVALRFVLDHARPVS